MAKRNSRNPLSKEEKRPLNKKNVAKLLGIFRFIRPYRSKFTVGFLSLILSSFTLLAFPFFAGKLIDAASGKTDWIISDLNTIALLLIGVLFVQGIFSYLRVYFFTVVSEKSMADIRSALYEKMMLLPMSFYDRTRTGELISRITSDISMLQETFSTTLAEFIRQIATLSIGVIIIFVTAPKLTWFMLAVFPLVILIGLVFGRFIRKLSKEKQDELAGANIVVEETLQSITMVKAFTSEWFEIGRYRSALEKVVTLAIKAAKYRGAFISFIIFALFGAIVAVMWYGAQLVLQGEMTTGTLLSFLLYTTFIGGSIAGLGDLFGQVQRAIGSSERVLEILTEPGESDNKGLPRGEKASKGHLILKQVKFSYPTRPEVMVLNHLNLEIRPGEKIALVGPSGAGKSTISQLLLRLYEPDSGQILLDGKPASIWNLADYRRNFGIVPQEVILFGGTIRENILYGKHDATNQELIEAARQANALQFIETFPEGFETLVGERGVKLSGGQRQRIAIARAILKDPRILILDEATSSLDAESESLVQEALESLMKNRTTVIIAHRLATIRKVDRIYVIGKGNVMEAGTHDELSRLEDGSYRNLVKLQLEIN